MSSGSAEGHPQSAREKRVFLDLEASSLMGWPIEIGLASVAEGSTQVWSSLIAPRPDWGDCDWDPKAEGIHGISRTSLSRAPSADQVAREVEHRIAGVTVISDAPTFDRRWLWLLLGREVQIEGFHSLVRRTISPEARPAVKVTLAKSRKQHRAGSDAEVLARAWLAGRDLGLEIGAPREQATPGCPKPQGIPGGA